jgi:hypothetical protein
VKDVHLTELFKVTLYILLLLKAKGNALNSLTFCNLQGVTDLKKEAESRKSENFAIFFEKNATKICRYKKNTYLCCCKEDPKLCCSIYFGVSLLRSKLALFFVLYLQRIKCDG